MKKFFICLFTALMLVSIFTVSALDLDTAEAADSVSNDSDAALAAVTFPVTPKPGINLATGTSEPLTFEDGAELGGLFKALSNATYVKDQAVADITSLDATGNDSDKALRIGLYKNTGADGTAAATGGWHGIHLNMTMQMDRKYYIAADEYADLYTINPDAVTIGDTFALWSTGIQDTKQALGLNSKEGKWYKQVWDNNLNHMPSNHFTGAFSFAFQLTSDTAYNAYIDNLMVVPYYLITYAGTETTTEWFLFDESGNIAAEYTPKSDNYPADYTENGKIMTCIGWAEYEGAAEASAAIALYNTDVTLYPVWQEAALLTASTTVLGDEGTAVITATEDVTWSYDEDTTALSVTSSTARTLEVSTAAENTSGEFTVTAETADGEIADITVHVIKSTPVLRPGLNMLTGTEKAMDFENYDKVPSVFSLTDTSYMSDMSVSGTFVASTGNGSGSSLHLHRNNTTISNRWQSVFRIAAALENGRPYSVSVKMFTDLYVNGSTVPSDQNARVYWGWTGGSAGSAWVNFDNNFTNPVKTGAWYNYSNTNLTYSGTTQNTLPIGFELTNNDLNSEVYCFDDILIMPYYKITYKNPDGTDASTVYALYDSNGAILDEYTIDASLVAGATGFALTQEDADAGNWITTVPLDNEDIVLYSTSKSGILFTDGTSSKLFEIAESFTFPTAKEAGVKTENFIKWTNGTDHYNAGDVIADASEYDNTVFTAFYQDASKPAMGMNFEGDGTMGTPDAAVKPNYTEYVEEDGRDYYHVAVYNTAGTYAADAKFWFPVKRFSPTGAAFDTTEYTIFSYGAKVLNAANLADSVVTEPETVTVRAFYYIPSIGLSENVKVGNTNFTANTNEYFNITFDMADLNSSTWNSNEIDSFILEPVRTNYSFNLYFDYLRVYRKGLTTVTYDTNAPDGAAVITNVAAETGRGVGTDYKLTGLQPAVEGYEFMGWSLTKDGADTVEAIDLTGDTTVYAVWKASNALVAPTVTDEYEIRGTGETNGIRFKSEIMSSEKLNLTEFGFIATREILLPTVDGSADYTTLNFDFVEKSTGSVKYAYGVSYNKAAETDIIYSDGENGEIIYTAVLTGIPLAYKKEAMAVRSYAKYEINGNDVIIYGNTRSASLYDTAVAIKDENGAAYEANKTYINSILEE